MLDGSFDYKDPDNGISGYYDGHTLTVQEGHHRVQAAMELYQQTGNAYYLNELINLSLRPYKMASGIPGVKPITMPAPLKNTPPPQGWKSGPFPPAEPK
jgi:hypothetical protein